MKVYHETAAGNWPGIGDGFYQSYYFIIAIVDLATSQ